MLKTCNLFCGLEGVDLAGELALAPASGGVLVDGPRATMRSMTS